MLSSARRWLRQNRTPIAIGAAAIGAGYVVTQYAISKINDARERMSSDRIAKENLRRRFEQNQEDCTFTVLALLPTAATNILERMNTESITYEIQQLKGAKSVKTVGDLGSPPSIADTTMTEEESKSMVSMQSDSGIHASQTVVGPSPFSATLDVPQQDSTTPHRIRKSKRQLWDDLTISAVTRSFTMIYTLALLTMLTRIQLNLLGRRSYLSSVIALATGTQSATISLENNDDDAAGEQAYGSDFDTNRKYLAFSWWVLNKGWEDMMKRVESAVRTVFGSLSPRDLVSFNRFAELTIETRKLIEGSTPEERQTCDWLRFLLPPQSEENDVIRKSRILDDTVVQNAQPSPDALRRLLDETADLIESPSFSHVLTLLLDAGFTTLVDKKVATEAFEFPRQESNGVVQTGHNDLKRTKVILLPKILSVLTRQAHVIGSGVANEYLPDMESVRDLEAFAAVVYSSNWQSEVQAEQDEASLMDSAIHVQKPEEAQQNNGEFSIVAMDNPAQSLESAWGRAVASK